MSDMVAVIGEDGACVGQLFPRRAHQLVKKQRAAWVDEFRRSVRLSPGTELDLEDTERRDEFAGESVYADLESKAPLYEAARRRVLERRNFIWHMVALVPGYFVLLLFQRLALINYGYATGMRLMPAFLLGVWTTLFAVHAVTFAKTRNAGFWRLSEDEKIRREIRRMEGL